jgi:hypothetical protein
MDIQQGSCPYYREIREESSLLHSSQNLCPPTSYHKKIETSVCLWRYYSRRSLLFCDIHDAVTPGVSSSIKIMLERSIGTVSF